MHTHRSTRNCGPHGLVRAPDIYPDAPESRARFSQAGHVFIMFLACVAMFAGLFLLAGGSAGSLGPLPWLFLLLCPVLHLLLHRSHGDR